MKKIDKRVLIGIGIIIIIIIGISLFFILKNKDKDINTKKLNDEEIVKGQEEVTNIVRGYVDNISNIKEYARDNSKIEFSIKELRGIFNIDTSSFKNSKYNCNEDTTFIKYDENYNDYIVLLDCKAFYLE